MSFIRMKPSVHCYECIGNWVKLHWGDLFHPRASETEWNFIWSISFHITMQYLNKCAYKTMKYNCVLWVLFHFIIYILLLKTVRWNPTHEAYVAWAIESGYRIRPLGKSCITLHQSDQTPLNSAKLKLERIEGLTHRRLYHHHVGFFYRQSCKRAQVTERGWKGAVAV